MTKFKFFLKYLFSKKFRIWIKQIRMDCTVSVFREMFPRDNCSYSEYLKNGY